jgi:hypothetical protein
MLVYLSQAADRATADRWVAFDLVAGARVATGGDEAARQIPDEDALMYQECGGPSSAERTTCPPTYGTFPDPTTLAIR